MDIRERENHLFEIWQAGREGFTCDGVVSEVDYLNAKVKLCFVLKEVNDENGGGWDLRELIRSEARPQTWNNITRWVRCIEKIDDDIPWSLLVKVSKEDRIKYLRSVCAMNMKKSPGSHTTILADFETAVSEDRAFIEKQYAIYKPDMTICCGTGWDLRWVLDLNDEEVFETSRGIKWFMNKENKPVVIYLHPAARVQGAFLVYGLVDAVREILAKVKQ